MSKKLFKIFSFLLPLVFLGCYQYASGTISSFQEHVLSTLSLNRCIPHKLLESQEIFPIFHVVDGDTEDILENCKVVRLRLLGINTPETVDPRKKVQCFGPEASAEAKTLLQQTSVRLETDPSHGIYDKYGRTLAYIYLFNQRTQTYDQSYNLFMIQKGFAYEYTYFNQVYKYQQQFKTAQADAEKNQRGLWSSSTCNGKL